MRPARVAVANPTDRNILTALEMAQKKGWIEPFPVISDSPEEAATECVDRINGGAADLLMKGNLDTSILLKAVLDPEKGLRTGNRLSHIAVVESPAYNRLMLMTDGGVNPEIDFELAESLIENSIAFARNLGIQKPHVAVLALVEKVHSSLPETLLAERVVSKYQNDARMIIEGPVPLDIALSERAAAIKGYTSAIAGKTDIFIGPAISTVNFTVKALLKLGGARGGGLVMGARTPIILLSRADEVETNLNSIALGLIARKGDL